MGGTTLHALGLRFAGTTAVLTALAAAYLVPAVLLDDPTPGARLTGPSSTEPGWTPELARAFPRCTDQVTWARRHRGRASDGAGAVPADVVVVGRDGTPRRMEVGTVEDRAASSRPGDDVRVVGWCS